MVINFCVCTGHFVVVSLASSTSQPINIRIIRGNREEGTSKDMTVPLKSQLSFTDIDGFYILLFCFLSRRVLFKVILTFSGTTSVFSVSGAA